MQILDSYVLTEPSDQNVLDIFEGEWSSKLPDKFGLSTAPGTAGLFEDARVDWAEQVFGNFTDWNILELGPLEAGHSYMFQEKKASSVLSIEANTRAYLKCLSIKEILKLDKVEFKLGDFITFMEKDNSKYDLVFASGILYHMMDPIKLLKLMSNVSDRLFIWTHYYDAETVLNSEDLSQKFSPVETLEFEGESYKYATQSYGKALGWSGFCGGPEQTCKWLTRDSIFKALKEFGFTDIQVHFDTLNHQNGPSFAICAKK